MLLGLRTAAATVHQRRWCWRRSWRKQAGPRGQFHAHASSAAHKPTQPPTTLLPRPPEHEPRHANARLPDYLAAPRRWRPTWVRRSGGPPSGRQPAPGRRPATQHRDRRNRLEPLGAQNPVEPRGASVRAAQRLATMATSPRPPRGFLVASVCMLPLRPLPLKLLLHPPVTFPLPLQLHASRSPISPAEVPRSCAPQFAGRCLPPRSSGSEEAGAGARAQLQLRPTKL
jgi:hypothetical protein